MLDILFIVIGLGFLGGAMLYAVACDRLWSDRAALPAGVAAPGPADGCIGTLATWAKALRTASNDSVTADLALQDEIAETVKRYPDTSLETWYDLELEVVVDRERARFSSWYELFPRSWSPIPGQHGTLRDVTDVLKKKVEAACRFGTSGTRASIAWRR